MGATASRDAKTTTVLAKQAMAKEEHCEVRSEFSNADEFDSHDAITSALRTSGIESVNLLVGLDFTASNRSQGKNTFGERSLHDVSSGTGPTPYEQVMDVAHKVLSPLDEDDQVPVFSFGDVESRHTDVKMLDEFANPDGDLKALYRKAATKLKMSGPTSFAPAINFAIKQIEASGGHYHVLLLITDGVVSQELNCLADSRSALVRASNYPLSVIIVGVGDGPWDEMSKLDDQLPERRFDNVQFVVWSPIGDALRRGVKQVVAENAFAVAALQELPAQYAAIKGLKLMDRCKRRRTGDGPNEALPGEA